MNNGIIEAEWVAKKPDMKPFPPSCDCDCGDYLPYPVEHWLPSPQYPFPYPCPPAGPDCGSIEGQIAKLSKKSATIRKMIENLTKKKKSIIISIGPGATYNFGTYLNIEGEETEYGETVLEMLQKELDAIKAKIVELTNELEVATSDDELSGPIGG